MTDDTFDHDVEDLISLVDHVRIDHASVPQMELDLDDRNRTNLFPWRGQFSPELVYGLIRRYAKPDGLIFDPFLGSGTTLFEALRLGMSGSGCEINPAAIEMAKTIYFAGLCMGEREIYLSKARNLLKDVETEKKLTEVLNVAKDDPLLLNLLLNAAMRHSSMRTRSNRGLLHALKVHESIIRGLPYTKNKYNVFNNDARQTPIEDETIDLVVTSPPYINVFNYHQNFRDVMELAGWNLLEVAQSEIGSNRKNRGNRFLTVVQYCLEMLGSLQELRRVIKQDGRIIVVVGRESRVRGVRFENFKLLSLLATGGAGLELVQRQERKFTNRFGETIYEDLLHFCPIGDSLKSTKIARDIAEYYLKTAAGNVPDDINDDIKNAICAIPNVSASPLFDIKLRGVTHD